jgi:two-component system cell cycle response regulator DivK
MRLQAFEVPQMQQQQSETTERTILLVEDDDETRRGYSVMLRRAGFKVLEAANGRDAVQFALEDAPDLILMDMNLPMLDGWEAARRIRADNRAGSTPLLAFSALIDSIADLRPASTLFDGFIAKPVSPAELVRRVAAYAELLSPSLRKRGEPARPHRARREPSAIAPPAGTALQ